MCDIQQISVSSKWSVLEINHRMICEVLLELEATGSMQEVPVLPAVLSNDAASIKALFCVPTLRCWLLVFV